MNRSFVVVLLVALLLLGSVAVSASEPKATPNWYALRQDMEMFKGALKSIMDDVATAYLPGYGVVILCECSFKGVERVSIVCYGTSFPDWEWTYGSKAGSSANPETWDVYLNVAPE